MVHVLLHQRTGTVGTVVMGMIGALGRGHGRGPGHGPGATSARRRRHHRSVGDAVTALIAELLLIAGAGTGLFVVWTAWWTDVAADRDQAALVQQLGQTAAPRGGTQHRDAPPVLEQPSHVGDVFGTVRIPRFGADYDRPLGQGTDRQRVLNTIGLGHYVDTAMPGGVGNVAIAGHRVTYGRPLHQIAELHPGDPIVVRVTDRARSFDVWYVYRVTGSRIVVPTQVEVIASVPDDPDALPGPTDRALTLTACHPMWSAAERFVTHATFDYWMPADEGTPRELREGLR